MKKIITLIFIAIFSLQLSAQEVIDTVQVVEKDENIISRVVDWYMDNLNYGTITLLMTVESSFIPFPSEVVVPPAAYAACNPESSLYATEYEFLNVLFVVLFATLGALLGAFINYFLSLFLGRPIIYWFADSKLGHLLLLNSEKIQKAENYFVAHGNASTFIGRLVPGIRQLISVPAGLAKMNLLHFSLFTLLGAGIWNVVLAVLGYIAHGQKDIIDQYSHELSWILLGLGVLFILYLVIQGLRKKKKKENSTFTQD